MNKQLASLLFYNETLYVNPVENIEDTPEMFATEKHVLVLSEKLSKKESDFLEKVLRAVKLSLADVATSYKSINLPELVALKSVKYIIVFGDLISRNTLTVNRYTPAKLDGKIFLLADPVIEIEKNQQGQKTKLWNALKNIFF